MRSVGFYEDRATRGQGRCGVSAGHGKGQGEIAGAKDDDRAERPKHPPQIDARKRRAEDALRAAACSGGGIGSVQRLRSAGDPRNGARNIATWSQKCAKPRVELKDVTVSIPLLYCSLQESNLQPSVP